MIQSSLEIRDWTVEVWSGQVGTGPQSRGVGLYDLVFFVVFKKGTGMRPDQAVASLVSV